MSNKKKEMTPQERYFSARGAWMFFVLATAINLVLGLANAKWQFPFLSEIVRLIAGLGESFLFDGIGLAITAVFAWLWWLSEKRYAVLPLCTVIYLIDTVLAFVGLINGSMDTMILLCVVIRLLLAWAMLMGVKAGKLLKMAEEQPMVILKETEEEKYSDASENAEN